MPKCQHQWGAGGLDRLFADCQCPQGNPFMMQVRVFLEGKQRGPGSSDVWYGDVM